MASPARAVTVLLIALLVACTAERTLATERVILERKSAFSTITVTETDAGLRVLRFERFGARQSVVRLGDPDHLELAYTRSLPIALALIDAPRRILIVGLGGGTIPSFLRKRLPEAAIDVVEIDPEVVATAKSHFGFRHDAKLRPHVDDGRAFIERSRESYDLIILDAFGIDSVPHTLTTLEFLQHVRRTLALHGLVVGNVWGRGDNRLYDSMIRTYRAVFRGVAIVDVPGTGNKLVMACDCDAMPTRETVVDRARGVGRRLDLRHDLAALAASGYREPGIDGVAGELLRDGVVPH